MRKIIFVFVLCASVRIMGMDCASDMHHERHLEELAFITSSNNPLTTATAVGNCSWCMVRATCLHRYRNNSLLGWMWNCCKRKSTIHGDVRQAVWNAAAHSEKVSQFILLLEFDNAFEVTKAGRSLLFHAVAHMNVPAARVLLMRGASVGQSATGNCMYAKHTPLMVAVHAKSDKNIKKRIEMVNLLLEYGASVNSWQKDTPLLLAKDKEIASILIDRGAFIDDSDSNGHTIFDAEFMNSADHNDPQTEELVKKILVEGSFRTHMIGIADDDCSVLSEPLRLVERELLLRQVVLQFKQAKIPREVQASILNYLPFSKNMCSVFVLSHIGDQITQEYADFAVEHVSEAVLKRAINEIKAEDQKYIFTKRLADAFTRRRIGALESLMDKNMQSHKASVGCFVGNCIPEYNLASEWSKMNLVKDIQAHYQNKLLRAEK